MRIVNAAEFTFDLVKELCAIIQAPQKGTQRLLGPMRQHPLLTGHLEIQRLLQLLAIVERSIQKEVPTFSLQPPVMSTSEEDVTPNTVAQWLLQIAVSTPPGDSFHNVKGVIPYEHFGACATCYTFLMAEVLARFVTSAATVIASD